MSDVEYYQIAGCSSSDGIGVSDVVVVASGGERRIGGSVKKCLAGITCEIKLICFQG